MSGLLIFLMRGNEDVFFLRIRSKKQTASIPQPLSLDAYGLFEFPPGQTSHGIQHYTVQTPDPDDGDRELFYPIVSDLICLLAAPYGITLTAQCVTMEPPIWMSREGILEAWRQMAGVDIRHIGSDQLTMLQRGTVCLPWKPILDGTMKHMDSAFCIWLWTTPPRSKYWAPSPHVRREAMSWERGCIGEINLPDTVTNELEILIDTSAIPVDTMVAAMKQACIAHTCHLRLYHDP